jgi:hypothetical protein
MATSVLDSVKSLNNSSSCMVAAAFTISGGDSR